MAQVTDYSPEAEGPRDCCANLAMVFRTYVEEPGVLDVAPPTMKHFAAWASRLERAVAKLDAEKISQEERVAHLVDLSMGRGSAPSGAP